MRSVLALVSVAFVLASCTKEAPRASAPVKNPDQGVKGDVQHLPGEIDPNTVKNWFTKGPEEGVQGVNAEALYKSLKAQPAKEIVVAVIDSGIDIQHEDLKGKIWRNEAECNGKPGVDDETDATGKVIGNGYIDDCHGWNFIGGVDEEGKPTHIGYEALEITRQKARLTKKKESDGLTAEEEKTLEKVTVLVNEGIDYAKNLQAKSETALAAVTAEFPKVEKILGVKLEELTTEHLEKAKPDAGDAGKEQKAALDAISAALKKANAKSVARLHARINYAKEQLEYHFNEAFDPRSEIVKDRPDDFTDVKYGNNDVFGPDADHGTHVAGIIAANRSNALGIEGVATNVKIMVLRAVPNGDERDKDIALAVRYAADNGAKIINMSFGKNFSPNKPEVDAAFLYAASKGVILVHAAGNSSQDNDVSDNFPNRYVRNVEEAKFTEIPTWVEVGASSRFNDKRLPADFSNFGQNSVDLFAPGHELNSTVPGNKYAVLSGTSMAAPVVSGVLALTWSLRPDLSAAQVRNLVLQRARLQSDRQVIMPGFAAAPADKQQFTPFGALSRTGAIADVFEAMK